MLPLADLTLWLLTILVEAFVVYLFLIRGLFRKFLFLSFYLLLSVAISISGYAARSHFGYSSSEYLVFYYFSHALLTVVLFLSICELGVRLVGTKMFSRRVVLWSAGALLAMTWFSFSVASSWDANMMTHFYFELTQNIYYGCCLVVALLWAWRVLNDPEDRIAARLVNVLTVYFSVFLLTYGARQLPPYLVNNLWLMIGAWLPFGCGFAIVFQE